VTADPRVARAIRVLVEHGVGGAEVSVEGHEREIAAVRVPDGEWERLLGDEGVRIAAAVKEVGFRYVALDLEIEADPDPAG
jgi:PP-loop superfamily ATP-utilizing enzyme